MQEDLVQQSLFILDNHQKIILLRNDDGFKFYVKKMIDYSHHNLAREVHQLYSYDWTHVFVTKRTLSFDDKTYNLKTQMWVEFKVPDEYYGQEIITGQRDGKADVDEEEEEDEDALREQREKLETEGKWSVS